MAMLSGIQDYEGAIYTSILLIVYFLLLGISVFFFRFKIPVVIAVHQAALVSLSVILGVFVVRRFRNSLLSFVSVITQTTVIPVTTSPAAASEVLTSAAVDPNPDPLRAADTFGLEVFGGEPNF